MPKRFPVHPDRISRVTILELLTFGGIISLGEHALYRHKTDGGHVLVAETRWDNKKHRQKFALTKSGLHAAICFVEDPATYAHGLPFEIDATTIMVIHDSQTIETKDAEAAAAAVQSEHEKRVIVGDNIVDLKEVAQQIDINGAANVGGNYIYMVRQANKTRYRVGKRVKETLRDAVLFAMQNDVEVPDLKNVVKKVRRDVPVWVREQYRALVNDWPGLLDPTAAPVGPEAAPSPS